MEAYEKFERLCEILNKETIYEAIVNYLPTDELDDFCEQLITEQYLEEEFGYDTD